MGAIRYGLVGGEADGGSAIEDSRQGQHPSDFHRAGIE